MAVWLVLAVVTTLPYARAALRPPDGRAFLGVLFQVEDIYNYLGYVRQAEDGRFFFQNKLVTEPHRGALVNVEWWLTGTLSRALGRRPTLAFRIVGVAAALALVVGVSRLLALAGLPDRHLLAALVFVFSAGGIGGLRFVLFGLEPWRSLDLIAGLYPFIEILINPHFVWGTALLVWTLLAFERAPRSGGPKAAALFGSLLALSRPYDAALVLAIAGLATAFTRPPRRWLPEIAPLLPVLAPIAYTAWVLYRLPAFVAFSSMSGYSFPPPVDIAVALGPAAVAALAGVAVLGRQGLVRARMLAAWAVIGAFLAVFHPLAITLQFLVGMGIPLAGLAVIGAARWRPWLLFAAAAAFATTPFVAMRIVMGDNGRWLVPAERVETAKALGRVCGEGDIALTPPDIGLYMLAHASCRPFLAHVATRDFDERDALARRFYTVGPPEWRAAAADERCITHLVLAGEMGDAPERWMGPGTAFRRVARIAGPSGIAVYGRGRPAGCP